MPAKARSPAKRKPAPRPARTTAKRKTTTRRAAPAARRKTVAAPAPRIVTPEQGEGIKPFGLDMRIVLTSEETNGAFAAIMATLKPGEGPPPHFHRDRDEYVYVVEGTWDVQVGEAKSRVGAGTLMFIPANTVHAFKNVGRKPGKMLDWSLPGGQENYFRTIHQLAAGGGFSAEKVHAISKEFDTEFPG